MGEEDAASRRLAGDGDLVGGRAPRPAARPSSADRRRD
jgi:hypothetical protein